MPVAGHLHKNTTLIRILKLSPLRNMVLPCMGTMTSTVLLLALLTSVAAAPSPPSNGAGDHATLLAFKAQLADPHGILLNGRTSNVSFCDWVGVSCSGGPKRVTALELPNIPLLGEISSHLGNLSFLSVLNLANTQLIGSIPMDIGKLTRLRILDLGHNTLSGVIPPALGNLTSIQVLRLNSNHLSGTTPELQGLHCLRYMVLDDNFLTGKIPIDMFNSTPSLSYLSFENNSLSGAIPNIIGSLSKLRLLNLHGNMLSGQVPPAIFNMSILQTLILGSNYNLSGPIPSNDSFHLPMLEVFSLGANNFMGRITNGLAACKHIRSIILALNLFVDLIPTWLANLSRLSILSLGGNHIYGSIPSVLSNLTMLRVLDLSYCNLNGDIPAELDKMKQLTYFHLSANQLTGSFPSNIANLSHLSLLQVRSNLLKGSVPAVFGYTKSLVSLVISDNLFEGKLDFLASLSSCKNLQYIEISSNSFTGVLPTLMGNLSITLLGFLANDKLNSKVPATITNLTNLKWLDLSNNQISNEIPESITLMGNLGYLNLSNNFMSGTIPAKIGMLKSLELVIIDNNKFLGPVPNSIGNLSTLHYISFSNNNLSSTIPTSLTYLETLVHLNLSGNSITGALPLNFSNMKVLSQIDISNNHLVGSIPNSIGLLQMLTILRLSHNSLGDSIPYTFDNLVILQILDLSSNNLSGVIPNQLAKLTTLSTLNLSFNKLEGQVPDGGVFSNITMQSLIGNTGLCGALRLGILPCEDNSHSSDSTHRHLLKKHVLLPLTAVFGVTAMFLYLIVLKKKKQKREVTSPADISGVTNRRMIPYHEVIRATGNFNEDNMLGVGSFGKVFKGTLDDGLVVAIKVLNMQADWAMRSFDTECQALRTTRHRNLIKVLNVCSNLDFKALLLQYMPNGSLEEYLYTGRWHSIGSFIKRLDIMLDVAMAIEYLHHDHHEVVLHCDLKPSNVLFDEDMTAHVADFGIAKLVLGDDNSILSASMPGTIGYMAPEYAFMGKASRKSDVFSYGIMLLEVFTRKRPTDSMFVGELSLRQWVLQAFPENRVEVVDNMLLQDDRVIGYSFQRGDSTSMQSTSTGPRDKIIFSTLELGLLCSSNSPEQRPSMNHVVVMLKNIRKDYSASFQETQLAQH